MNVGQFNIWLLEEQAESTAAAADQDRATAIEDEGCKDSHRHTHGQRHRRHHHSTSGSSSSSSSSKTKEDSCINITDKIAAAFECTVQELKDVRIQVFGVGGCDTASSPYIYVLLENKNKISRGRGKEGPAGLIKPLPGLVCLDMERRIAWRVLQGRYRSGAAVQNTGGGGGRPRLLMRQCVKGKSCVFLLCDGLTGDHIQRISGPKENEEVVGRAVIPLHGARFLICETHDTTIVVDYNGLVLGPGPKAVFNRNQPPVCLTPDLYLSSYGHFFKEVSIGRWVQITHAGGGGGGVVGAEMILAAPSSFRGSFNCGCHVAENFLIVSKRNSEPLLPLSESNNSLREAGGADEQVIAFRVCPEEPGQGVHALVASSSREDYVTKRRLPHLWSTTSWHHALHHRPLFAPISGGLVIFCLVNQEKNKTKKNDRREWIKTRNSWAIDCNCSNDNNKIIQ